MKTRSNLKSATKKKHRGRPPSTKNLINSKPDPSPPEQKSSFESQSSSSSVSLDFNFSNCCCYSLSFLTNTATKLATMELPLAYRALCNLFDFASLSELQSNNKNSSSFEPNEFNPLFEDALIEEVDRLSRKFGHRFFFRLFTALTQRSNKFPLFLASHPNHGDLFLSIMATFAGEDEEESGNEYGDEEQFLIYMDLEIVGLLHTVCWLIWCETCTTDSDVISFRSII